MNYRATWLIVFALLGPAAAGALAHDGPEEAVAALSAEIEQSGPSADLLYRRGCEYAALRNHVAAEADLRRSLAMRPEFPAAQALVRILLARSALAEAARVSEAEVRTRRDRGPHVADALALDAEVQA